jgi:hypothetical protein
MKRAQMPSVILTLLLLNFGLRTARSQTYTAATLTLGSSYQVTGSAVLGDFNGDGLVDVFAAFKPVSGGACGEIGVWLQQSNHTFLSKPSQLVYDGSACGQGYMRVADINGDGKLDVIEATSTIVQVFTGNGNGTFAGPDVVYSDNPSLATIAGVGAGKFTSSGPATIALLQGHEDYPTWYYDVTVLTNLVLNPTVSFTPVESTGYFPNDSLDIYSRTGNFVLPSMNNNTYNSAQIMADSEIVMTGSSTGLLSYAGTLSAPIACTGLDVNGDGIPDCVGFNLSNNQMVDVISPLSTDKTNVLFTINPTSSGYPDDVFAMQYGSTKRDFGYDLVKTPSSGPSTFTLSAAQNNGSGTFTVHQIYSSSIGRAYIDSEPGGANQRTYVLICDHDVPQYSADTNYYVLQGGIL